MNLPDYRKHNWDYEDFVNYHIAKIQFIIVSLEKFIEAAHKVGVEPVPITDYHMTLMTEASFCLWQLRVMFNLPRTKSGQIKRNRMMNNNG